MRIENAYCQDGYQLQVLNCGGQKEAKRLLLWVGGIIEMREERKEKAFFSSMLVCARSICRTSSACSHVVLDPRFKELSYCLCLLCFARAASLDFAPAD